MQFDVKEIDAIGLVLYCHTTSNEKSEFYFFISDTPTGILNNSFSPGPEKL